MHAIQSQRARLAIAFVALPVAVFAAWMAWLIVPAIVEQIAPRSCVALSALEPNPNESNLHAHPFPKQDLL